MNNEMDIVLGWDDEIEKDGQDFVLLPEGDYNFKVTGFMRKQHNGSAKLPPCPKAELDIELSDDKGNSTVVKHSLFLHSRTEGLLSAFFIAIGQKKHGEKVRMNWNAVIGSTGRCKVAVREWTNDKGEKRQSNEIKKFYEPAAPAKFVPGQFGAG